MAAIKKKKGGDFVVIFITASSFKEAERIGKGLVKKGLAGCANIIQPIRSIFFWKGKLCQENEVLLLVKSRAGLFDSLMNYVKKNHSYKIPEIVAIPIVYGLPDYMAWLDESCKPLPSGRMKYDYSN
ncbi:MAG: hypothetical protein A3I04_00575 [Nitrospinae bacterium RIFCSPLOWO2_02_FULL_39_110]|nr:MAG: hypothetical protein A2W53_03970 [Nitrospinae bacterium RIFCSPHIGHO2_02_39_11]OGW00713.1 MAG: hypothetical protein A3D97_08235 [Nitrospinae bacterium RIFCSPHIGHO2_12_FULL_39_42]OGW02030.1 MAG: hypothetical protein A3D20_01355 [Nitrospinae bacterium RIFCSPHIGHO2_02_FULL_39_82]OGW04513.1 MAG: hypothetical protein A2Z59_11890 [Nitrospinae bacterium RIFCSPLOWO2_02_39_17]OGW06434.1 MAG: hypothetical protein A3I04_00575 [Nitrospinae bacterium RIFCSPLOWO2_02_FULL_39_110]OGW08144.1 MAG: hypoth